MIRIDLKSSFLLSVFTIASFASAGEPARRALLVGCSNYSEDKGRLLGPTNDVLLMKQVLTTRLGFRRDNIVELYDEQPVETLRPTHAHIVREFEALIKKTEPGDRVVLFFAGHGAQQPSQNLKNEEPDGLDEVFLPTDAGVWNDSKKLIVQSIVDNTFDDWLTTLRRKGAHVWFVVDACFSGTLSRGGEEARVRRVDPIDLGLPRVPTTVHRDIPTIDEELGGDLIALFATQPHEAEDEQPLPILSQTGEHDVSVRYYGRLTWALAKIIFMARRSLTYAELVNAIHTEHLCQGVLVTPLLLGTAKHKEILGDVDWGVRQRFPLERMAEGKFMLPAGQVHGLTPGSMLAVLSAPTANPPDEVLGHVEIIVSSPLESVVRPVAFSQKSLVEDFPTESQCELVSRRLDSFRVPIGIHPQHASGRRLDMERLALRRAKLQLAADVKESFVEVAADISAAEWLLQEVDEHGLQLVTALANPQGPVPLKIGPCPEAEFADWLQQSTRSIAKVRELLRLSQPPYCLSNGKLGPVQADLKLLVAATKDGPWIPAAISTTTELQENQFVMFQVTNCGTESVDVTLLYVDDHLGITPLIPPASQPFMEIRIKPGGTITSLKHRVTFSPRPEHVLMIAVKAEIQRQPTSFEWLTQPSLIAAQQERTIRAAQRATRSGIREESESTMTHFLERFAFPAARGENQLLTSIPTYQMRLLTWTVRQQ